MVGCGFSPDLAADVVMAHVLAMFIPLKSNTNPNVSPLKTLEHDLHSVVAFFVLPVFAFANAGINLTGVTSAQLLHDVPLGVSLGLFVGKQVGIFGLCALTIKMGIAKMPAGMSWLSLYGTAALCGIGFTMSLFVDSLAYNDTQVYHYADKLAVLIGSFVSGLVGYLVLELQLELL